MSDLTSTNEETLVDILRRIGPNEVVHLRASSRILAMVEVYVLPLSWSPYGFEEKYGKDFWDNEEFGKKYHKASMMAISLHRDVWLKFGDASKYR